MLHESLLVWLGARIEESDAARLLLPEQMLI
jgi:hypothetical protein